MCTGKCTLGTTVSKAILGAGINQVLPTSELEPIYGARNFGEEGHDIATSRQSSDMRKGRRVGCSRYMTSGTGGKGGNEMEIFILCF